VPLCLPGSSHSNVQRHGCYGDNQLANGYLDVRLRLGLHDSTGMVSKRSHHIVHLLDRQDNSNKSRLDQTSAATGHTANIAITNQRVSTTVDMMIKPLFLKYAFVRAQRGEINGSTIFPRVSLLSFGSNLFHVLNDDPKVLWI